MGTKDGIKKCNEMTEDAIENEMHNERDMIWDTGKVGKKYESVIRKKLIDVFNRMGVGANNQKRYELLEKYVDSQEGSGSLTGMGYGSFPAWNLIAH